MNCDDCGKPCGDGAVPVVNDARFIVGYVCRHCAEAPPTLCSWGDCTQVATRQDTGMDWCQEHGLEERRRRDRERAHYLRGGMG